MKGVHAHTHTHEQRGTRTGGRTQGSLSPWLRVTPMLWVSWRAPCGLGRASLPVGLGHLQDAGNEHPGIATRLRRFLGEE